MRLLVLSLLLLSLPLNAALPLTEAQRDYLRSNPEVNVCVDPDWQPFEIIDARGEHQGIAADLLRLVAERAGLRLRILPTVDWEASLAASQAGRCQLLSFLNQTAERDAWLLFTEPLFNDVNVLISREEYPPVRDLAALVGARVALPSGTSIEERLRRQYPGLQIVHTQNEAQALSLVNQREAELTMRSLTVAAYTIKQEGWFNLKIAGQVEGFDNLFRIGVLHSEPLLRDLLNLAIASLTPAEVNAIVNRHVPIRIESPTNYRLAVQVALVFALVLLSNLFWIRRLRRLNRRLQHKSSTDVLTGLANRSELNRRSQICFEQAQRHARPLALIMLDLDHFKQVNDQLGHLVGDRVLRELAALLQGCVRLGDCLGRWGGEEFLLVCPETSGPQAQQLAERIVAQVRHHGFSSGRQHCLSAGVAECVAGESLDSLLQRADEALYQAKSSGRDRVCYLSAGAASPMAQQPG
ncbi:diguanylate cyclase domain-containing protein [Pseudomonas fluvialis]|uniref:diguanylate cyclase domain-containing protein n=1 Tax=Pseudomonas fluvialis TaxID=1793966 RepID=UPI00370B86F1